MNTCMHFMHPPNIVQIGWVHHVDLCFWKKNRPLLLAKGVQSAVCSRCTKITPGNPFAYPGIKCLPCAHTTATFGKTNGVYGNLSYKISVSVDLVDTYISNCISNRIQTYFSLILCVWNHIPYSRYFVLRWKPARLATKQTNEFGLDQTVSLISVKWLIENLQC